MDAAPDATSFKLGVLEGRVGAVEQRLDRHENVVGAALERFGGQIERFTTETRMSHSALGAKIDSIESKLDHEDGARAQKEADREAAASAQDAVRNAFFSKENIRLARWALIVSAIGVLIGVLGQAHFHLVTLVAH